MAEGWLNTPQYTSPHKVIHSSSPFHKLQNHQKIMAQNYYHHQLHLKTNTPRLYPSLLSTHYHQKKQKHKIRRQPMFVMKRNMDMKLIEKLYDCFILDFNPYETKKSYSCKKYDDVYITAEKGKVALKDYPHSRHLCARYPFPKTLHIKYCRRCYCYVCDIPAPCKHMLVHCSATAQNPHWKSLRRLNRPSKRRVLRA